MNAVMHDTYTKLQMADTNSICTDSVISAPYIDASSDVDKKIDRVSSSERLINAIEGLREVITVAVPASGSYGQKQRSKYMRQKQMNVGHPPSSPKTGAQKANLATLYEKSRKRRDKVIVELRVVFMKVGEIDTLKEQYHADLFIQAKWREQLLDDKSPEEMREIECDKLWNPYLYIDNIVTEQKDTVWSVTTHNAKGEVFVVERRRIKGVFLENLELNDFPLDVQDLTVTITTERPDFEVDIIPDDQEMSGVNVQTFADQQEWKLHDHIEVAKKTVTQAALGTKGTLGTSEQDYSAGSRAHPALSVTCRAARRPGYFYYNVFLIMFFITGLSFATFAVKPDLPQNRLQLSFTLLLTSIAFKFVINQSLPKISYLTYMDKYVLLSLVILCIICIWHSLVTTLNRFEHNFVAEVETNVFITFGVLYILCHVVFIFWLYFDACKRRRIMKEKDREYKAFLTLRLDWQKRSKQDRRQSAFPSYRKSSLANTIGIYQNRAHNA